MTDAARRISVPLVIVATTLAVFFALALTAKAHPGTGSFDARVERWAVDAPRSVHDAASTVTWLGSWLTLLPIALAVAIAQRLLRKTSWPVSLLPVVALAAAIVLYDTAKALVDRPRPPAVSIASSSFPSGHATASVAVWGSVALVLAIGRGRRARIALWTAAVLIALAVGASRLILGVHWPTDVIAGWALGAALLSALTLCGIDRITSGPDSCHTQR